MRCSIEMDARLQLQDEAVPGHEADLQRTLEKADYVKLNSGYNESVFSRLPCTFSANVFDAPATKFFDKWTYGNISGMAEVIKEGIPIVRIQRDEDTKEIKSRQIVS